MHRLPVDDFVAKGIHLSKGAEQIALVGRDAYMPHSLRTKRRPEPMLQFVIGWIRRNVPRHRSKASFIQFDSGQFLHAGGRMTGLYGFEFSMIGDPMVDLATMRMRNSYEPPGIDMRDACLADVEAITGRQYRDWPEAEAALEQFVKAAGPDQDLRLLRLLGAMHARSMQVYGPTRIGHSATHASLHPTR